MTLNSIADVYSANAATRRRLLQLAETVTPAEAAAVIEGEKWNVAAIFEHLVMVEEGVLKLCGRLLDGSRSRGVPGDGTLRLSENFLVKSAEIAEMKVEAPDRVQPAGGRPVADSMARLEQLRERFEPLRASFESYDVSEHHFPHPYLGDLTAAEWLVVLGRHEARHMAQIERLLERLRTQ